MTGRPSRSRPSVTGSSRSSPVHARPPSSSRSSTIRAFGIGHLDAHHVAPRDARHPDRARAHLEREVVGQRHQTIHLDARPESDAVLGHHRAGGAAGDVALDLELGERLLEPLLQHVELAPRPRRSSWVRGGLSSSTSQTGPSAFSPARVAARASCRLSLGRLAFGLAAALPATTAGSPARLLGGSAALLRPSAAASGFGSAWPRPGGWPRRSSRWRGCQAKVASVSAERARKPEQHRAGHPDRGGDRLDEEARDAPTTGRPGSAGDVDVEVGGDWPSDTR